MDVPPDMDGKSILKLLDIERPVNRETSCPWIFYGTLIKYLLHIRDAPPGKDVAQEENFLPKYQRVKDLCQRAEYQTPCQQLGQKWQCLEDATGKLRLYKCKGMASMSAARKDGPANIKSKYYTQHKAESNTEHDGCNCDQHPSFRLSTLKKKKLLSKKKMKAIKSYARNRYSRSVEMEIGGDLYAVDLEDGYQPVPAPRNLSQAGARTPRDDTEDDFSGMGVTVTVTPRTSSKSLAIVSSGIKVTHRCSILANDTVKCDTGIYKSLQAWKDHKLHIDHEVTPCSTNGATEALIVVIFLYLMPCISTLQTKIKNLREVRGHLKKARPEECDCNHYIYKSKYKSKLRHKGGSIHPFRKGQDKKAWLLKEQKRRKKMRKLLKRLRNNDTCSMPGLTCFTHDNQHWQTAPFWTMGPFCACTSANNNTYWCLRTINETHNFLFCEFATGFLEYFDLNTDPYQLMNAVNTLDRTVLNQLHVQLMELRSCKGHKQCNPRTRNLELEDRFGKAGRDRVHEARVAPPEVPTVGGTGMDWSELEPLYRLDEHAYDLKLNFNVSLEDWDNFCGTVDRMFTLLGNFNHQPNGPRSNVIPGEGRGGRDHALVSSTDQSTSAIYLTTLATPALLLREAGAEDWGPMSPRGGPLRTVISRVDVGLKPKGEGQWKLTIISAVVWVNECWELLLRNAHGPSIHAFV
ncbi:unnamed protein product [Oncorhynchus mykiss]|uniref:Extracellular sulfatase C-terminal domain-containing protein n=1 Tax=Oncorhynchus mykiss TaxID=8022 RepID=A0A060WT57_ONCMY|nr:unnamed protein product [Oncorhynchus mykiss]